WAAAEFERIGADGLVRVPLGVDLATFRPGGGQVRSRDASQGQILLVHAGRLSAEKKPQRSLTTLATLRAGGMPVRLVVAGDGAPRAPLAPPGAPGGWGRATGRWGRGWPAGPPGAACRLPSPASCPAAPTWPRCWPAQTRP